MDTDILEISTTSINGHAQFSGLGIGICTPLKTKKIPNIKKFTYDKAIGRIVQEKLKKSQS
jgi:hypothetical protein